MARISESSPREPTRRVIVLGASNVTRGLRVFCETAAGLWREPLDVMAAIGHGRSYGVSNTVFARTLPSIRTCELWEDWRQRAELPTAALITDVGNDLMYGFPPGQIAEWVGECAERLVRSCQRVVVSGLPLDSVRRLGARRFWILRALLFPNSQLTLEQALERAAELNEQVSAIARQLQLEWTTPDPSWFGLDPIHIRRCQWPAAWEQMLQPLGPLEERVADEFPVASWRLRNLRAKHRWLFGVEQRHPQPAWTGPDGSRLSLY